MPRDSYFTILLKISSIVGVKEGNHMWVPLLYPIYLNPGSLRCWKSEYREGSGDQERGRRCTSPLLLPLGSLVCLHILLCALLPHFLVGHSPQWRRVDSRGKTHSWSPFHVWPWYRLWLNQCPWWLAPIQFLRIFLLRFGLFQG